MNLLLKLSKAIKRMTERIHTPRFWKITLCLFFAFAACIAIACFNDQLALAAFTGILAVAFFAAKLCNWLFSERQESSEYRVAQTIMSIILCIVVAWYFFYRVYRITQHDKMPDGLIAIFGMLSVPQNLQIPMLFAALAFTITAAFFVALLFSKYLGKFLHVLAKYMWNSIDYEDPIDAKSRKQKWITCLALFLLTFLIGGLLLNDGQDWGPDFTLYIRQAIDLAEGHPENIHVVWGFSAMLVPIYLLFGYDRVTFCSIILYKIPGLFCISLLAVFIYLYFSRRVSKWSAVFLTICIVWNPTVIYYVNSVLTDVPYAALSMASLLCLFAFFERKDFPGQLLFAVLSGLLIAASDLTRLNGLVLLLSLACVHFIRLLCRAFKRVPYFDGINKQWPIRRPWMHAIPYAVYYITCKTVNALVFTGDRGIGANGAVSASVKSLRLVISNFFLKIQDALIGASAETLSVPQANGTSALTFSWLMESLQYYSKILIDWIADLLIYPFVPRGLTNDYIMAVIVRFAGILIAALIVVGVIRCFRKDLLTVIFTFGTMLLVSIVSFRSDFRYLVSIVPFVVFYYAMGVQTVAKALLERRPQWKRGYVFIRHLCMWIVFLLIGAGLIQGISHNLKNDRRHDYKSFSNDALDLYRYINNNTDEDALFIFNHEAVLSLNTDREAKGSFDVLDPERDTYFIASDEQDFPVTSSDVPFEELEDVALELEYGNETYQVYRIVPVIQETSTERQWEQ